MSNHKEKLLRFFPNWNLIVILKIAEIEGWNEIKDAIEKFLSGHLDEAIEILSAIGEDKDYYDLAIPLEILLLVKAFYDKMDTRLINKAVELVKKLSGELADKAREHIAWAVIDVSAKLAKSFRFKEALKIIEEFQFLATTEDSKHAFLGMKGKLYEKIGDYEKALRYYEEALNIGGSDWLISRTQINLRNLLVKIGRSDDAKNRFRRFLEEKKKLLEESGIDISSSPEIAKLYNEFGIILLESSDYENAKSYFNQAIGIWRSLVNQGKREFLSNLADSIHNLGLVFFEMNDFQRALEKFIDAYKIYENLIALSLYDFLEDYAVACNNIGLTYVRLKKYKDAENFFKKALSSFLRLVADVSELYIPDVATSFFNLGILYEETGLLDKASEYYQKALRYYQIANSKLGNAFIEDEAKVYLSLSRVFSKISDVFKSLEYLRKALEVADLEEKIKFE